MCPEAQWQKLPKVLWVQSVSPFENRILDIRMLPDPSRSIEVSTEHGNLFARSDVLSSRLGWFHSFFFRVIVPPSCFLGAGIIYDADGPCS